MTPASSGSAMNRLPRTAALLWRAGARSRLAGSAGGEAFLVALLPRVSEFLDCLAGVFLPEVVAVTAFAGGSVQLANDVRIVILGDPIDEIAGNAVARVISRLRDVPRRDIGTVGLRLVEKPADVIRDSFDNPARRAVAAAAAGASIL